MSKWRATSLWEKNIKSVSTSTHCLHYRMLLTKLISVCLCLIAKKCSLCSNDALQVVSCAFTLPAKGIPSFYSLFSFSFIWFSVQSLFCSLPALLLLLLLLHSFHIYFDFMTLLVLSRFSHVLFPFSLFHRRQYILFGSKNDVGCKGTRQEQQQHQHQY